MSELYLFNSLTRRKERFVPLQEGVVKMYICGVTVYDYCHIGHARVMVVFDTIARHFRAQGYDLTYVRNITDIDDKIIKRAQERNEDIATLTEFYTQAMHEDERALLCLAPDKEPRATECIDGMIALIADLLEKGFAYVAKNGDVYFAIERFPAYGKLANQKISDLRAGERIEINTAKKDPLDFVLWKAAKDGEPSWPSPWSKGRPGWHIECSVMSEACLGKEFDIHGGGMDLKFPHHECEIAQSEAHLGKQHVRYWLHNGFVQVNNEKMSKSLGNFFTIRDVLNTYDGEVIRFFILSSHYRGPLNYGDALLDEARNGLKRLYTALQDTEREQGELLPEYILAFDQAMNDDFNTPKALAVLFELARLANKSDVSQRKDYCRTLRTLGQRLGLLQREANVFLQQGAQDNAGEIEALIEERAQAKSVRDFAKADAIRERLKSMGIELEDGADGTRWKRA